MAKWILINEVIVGGAGVGQQGVVAADRLAPGTTIDDANTPTAPIVAAGGLLWPATDTVVAAAAVTAVALATRGQGQSAKLSDLLLAAAFYSLAGGSTGALLGESGVSGPVLGPLAAAVAAAIAAGPGVVQKRTVSVGFATFASTAAKTLAVDIGAALPANARILSRELRIATEFTGGGESAVTCSVGITTATTAIVNAQDVLGTSGDIAGTSGTDPQPLYASASQLLATYTSTTNNLEDLTAGAMVIDVLFVVLP